MHRDPHTLSNYDAWKIQHTFVSLEVDFASKRLLGTASYNVTLLKDTPGQVVLDTKHLDISSVHVDGRPVQYEYAAAKQIDVLGLPLRIPVCETTVKGDTIQFTIQFSTTVACTALQWLNPEQTAGKKHPYVFSQCQMIHARALFPCQDTPDAKSTYTIHVRSPLPVVAAGQAQDSPEVCGSGEGTENSLYVFEQQVPIPAYLFAIASGDLACVTAGTRTTLWTEPSELSAMKAEFEDSIETFVKIAEAIVGPYQWSTIDVVVLPPSFPFGGIENPNCIFMSPTIVSGDRQNISILCHELAHAWAGNLVTNASWEHFWLNEGWTVYLERRILAKVHGASYRDLHAILGLRTLTQSIAQLGDGHECTKLVPNLLASDPAEAFSAVPYEKGFLFLCHLENIVGERTWNAFIPHYFTTWKQRSLDSSDFRATLCDFVRNDSAASARLHKVAWDAWLYAPGEPPEVPQFDMSLVLACDELAAKWECLNSEKVNDTFTPAYRDVETFTTSQLIVFLENIQAFDTPLSPQLVGHLGEIYAIAISTNPEVTSRYIIIGLMSRLDRFKAIAREFSQRFGRGKYIMPLFKELRSYDLPFARECLDGNQSFYHPALYTAVSKILA